MYPVYYNTEMHNVPTELPRQQFQLQEKITNWTGNQSFDNYGYWAQNLEQPVDFDNQNHQWTTYQSHDSNTWNNNAAGHYPYCFPNVNTVMPESSMMQGLQAAQTNYTGHYHQFTQYAQGDWSLFPQSHEQFQQTYIGTTQNSLTLNNSPSAQIPAKAQSHTTQNSVSKNVLITLKVDHWNVFRAKGQSEQLANNTGRRLFPTLQFNVTGLDPNAQYVIGLQMIRVSGELEYDESQRTWSPKCKENLKIIIPDTSNELFTKPKNGHQLMKKNGVNLEAAKLYTIGSRTMKKEERREMIRVYSRHMYIPQVRITQKLSDGTSVEVIKAKFKEASFVVVSKVKDTHINALRTQRNKHSRFRDDGIDSVYKDKSEQEPLVFI